eukprot:5357288-Pyramimonas_sp.AAC.1
MRQKHRETERERERANEKNICVLNALLSTLGWLMSVGVSNPKRFLKARPRPRVSASTYSAIA